MGSGDLIIDGEGERKGGESGGGESLSLTRTLTLIFSQWSKPIFLLFSGQGQWTTGSWWLQTSGLRKGMSF